MYCTVSVGGYRPDQCELSSDVLRVKQFNGEPLLMAGEPRAAALANLLRVAKIGAVVWLATRALSRRGGSDVVGCTCEPPKACQIWHRWAVHQPRFPIIAGRRFGNTAIAVRVRKQIDGEPRAAWMFPMTCSDHDDDGVKAAAAGAFAQARTGH